MSGWTTRITVGRTRKGVVDPDLRTIVAVNGCRVIRLEHQTLADVEAFDPDHAWAGTTPPRINREITDLATNL